MNLPSIDALENGLPLFSEKILVLCSQLGLDLSGYQADHIAIRMNKVANAKYFHSTFAERGQVISKNMINGRPIIVVKLNTIIQVGRWEIPCIELPYPSEKTYPSEGWEHIEWVIPSAATTPEEFLDYLKQAFPELNARWDELENLGISVKLSSPSGEGERIANPTVAFKANGVCIKLHPVSLEAVIQSEASPQ